MKKAGGLSRRQLGTGTLAITAAGEGIQSGQHHIRADSEHGSKAVRAAALNRAIEIAALPAQVRPQDLRQSGKPEMNKGRLKPRGRGPKDGQGEHDCPGGNLTEGHKVNEESVFVAFVCSRDIFVMGFDEIGIQR
jgi:hypothetical protein